MELINQTKTVFKIGKDKEGNDIFFRINEVRDFDKDLGATLLRYEGINTLESLKAKAVAIVSEAKAASPAPVELAKSKSELDLLKEEATELGIEFKGNVSKVALEALIAEAKAAE